MGYPLAARGCMGRKSAKETVATPAMRVQRWVERAEGFTLVLAGVAVALYLAELKGVWSALGIEGPVLIIALLIDLVFVVDLLAKVWSMRGEYVRSPWFVVDLISATPILASLQLLPTSLQGLRFVRGFRVFRLMATLRVLRSLRILRALQIGKQQIGIATVHLSGVRV